jgi:hypothetical protein
VNFGVFALYGDRALDSAIETVLQLLVSNVPRGDVLRYPKLGSAALLLLQLIFRSHVEVVATLPHAAFVALIQLLSEALDSVDLEVMTHAA